MTSPTPREQINANLDEIVRLANETKTLVTQLEDPAEEEPPPPPPDVTLTATAGDAQVRLDWTVSGEGITGWTIARSGAGAPAPAQLAADVRTHTFTGLTNGTSYTFTLTPQTASGNLTDEVVTATPQAAPQQQNVAVNPVLATDAAEWCCNGTRVAVSGHPKAGHAYQVSGATIFPPKHPTAAAGQQWQIAVDCQGDGQVVLGVDWYNGATFLSSTKSAAVTMSPTGWVTPKVTATAPANTTRFQTRLDRTGATTNWRATNAFYSTESISEPPPPPPVGGRVSTSGRQFIRNGQRFIWLGDTAWSIFINLTREEVDSYLDTRRGQGFNVIQAVAIFPQAGGPGPNRYGFHPYSGSLANRPEGYWQHVDYVVNAAASRGMVMAILPCWADRQAGSLITTSNAREYGRFLGARYGSKDNIVWVMGGDAPATGQEGIWREIAAGLTEGGSTAIQTYHPRGDESSTQWFNNDAWIDFHMIQSGHCLNYSVDRSLYATAHANNGGKPWLDGEPLYDDHGICWWGNPPSGPPRGWATALDCRRHAYWAMVSGAAGHTYGDGVVWPFQDPGEPGPYGVAGDWRVSVNRPSANQMRYVQALFESRPRVEPANSAVTNPGTDASWTPAAKDAASTTLIAYLANGGSRSINLDVLAGTTAQPWWYNPRTGAATKLATVTSTGTVSFTSPMSNEDWVLVIDDAAAGYGAPGTTSAPPSQDGQTAAALLNWGQPHPISDEFNYSGPPDPNKWELPPPGGFPGHTGNGRRMPENVFVSNGMMTLRGDANGDTGWVRQRLDTRYGRWEIRSRSRNTGTSGGLYHVLHLIWPSSELWPQDGEYDFLEYTDPDATTVEGFLHYPHDAGPVQQEHWSKSGVDTKVFHNYAFEWTSAGLKGWVDGVQVFSFSGGATSTRRNIQDMPSGALTHQLDNFTGDGGLRPAGFEIEWVRFYPVAA